VAKNTYLITVGMHHIQSVETFGSTLVGQYCIVQYCGKPYPGRITNVMETDVEVECMHSVPSKYNTNTFLWPTTVKAICSYEHI